MDQVKIYYVISSDRSSDELIRLSASHYAGNDMHAAEIVRQRGKKPYFKNGEVHFSVSHSDILWVCAFSASEVGCDVQIRRDCPKFEKLAARWFSSGESEKTRTERDFFDIWSRKEAYTKLLGTGIDENFKKYDTFSLTDAVIKDFGIPGCKETFSASAACRREFEIEFFDINNI
jgi:phosphopantetheinyl transferase